MPDSLSLLPPPSSDERDIALGHYLYEWGKLEMQMLYLFHILSETKWAVARIIFSIGLQSNNLSTILQALGQLHLNENKQKKLNSLCSRYTEAASKRNKIVHGIWDIEPNYSNLPFAQWTRICSPTEPQKEKLMFNKHEQKIRGKYLFTIPKLHEASLNIESLAKDINEFTSTILNQIYYQEPL